MNMIQYPESMSKIMEWELRFNAETPYEANAIIEKIADEIACTHMLGPKFPATRDEYEWACSVDDARRLRYGVCAR